MEERQKPLVCFCSQETYHILLSSVTMISYDFDYMKTRDEWLAKSKDGVYFPSSVPSASPIIPLPANISIDPNVCPASVLTLATRYIACLICLPPTNKYTIS